LEKTALFRALVHTKLSSPYYILFF
jgi:hypothetical protein